MYRKIFLEAIFFLKDSIQIFVIILRDIVG